jgi:hypothetical protein
LEPADGQQQGQREGGDGGDDGAGVHPQPPAVSAAR